MRFMKSIAAAAAISSFSLIQFAEAQTSPEVKSLDMDAPKQILFVGNSYLYYGDSLHNHVLRMAKAADEENEDDYNYKSATISGAYLSQHNLESHLEPNALGLPDPFDVVVLQGHSTATTDPEKLENFRKAVSEFDDLISKTGARTALYMTPAYTEVHKNYDPEMITKIDDGYTNVGNEVDALVIPVGLAFEEAYARRPDIQLHKDFDGSHPSLLGTYLGAATTYAALYDKSVVGNPYDYYGAISAEDAAFLQQVAEDTVNKYYGR